MDKDIKVSLFASAVRPKLWHSLFRSLERTSVDYEVVFAGNRRPMDMDGLLPKNTLTEKYKDDLIKNFNYIFTDNIKPAQCYEIARRHCIGEVVIWIADDCEFPNDVLGKAYKYWKEQNNEKLILSIQTKESGYGNPKGSLFNMDLHRFFGGDHNSPLMAPLALMSRKFLEELGGIDRRYICGQYENSICMLAYQHGAKVEIFGGPDCYIDIDHLGKSILIGESKVEADFLNRPFATGYEHDRKILENSWCRVNEKRFFELINKGQKTFYRSEINDISPIQLDKFQPYAKDISLTESEGYKGKWE